MCTLNKRIQTNLEKIKFQFDLSRQEDTNYICSTLANLINLLANEVNISFEVNYDSSDDKSEFFQEVSNFLKIYKCPYVEFYENTTEHQTGKILSIINYLSIEIITVRIYNVKTKSHTNKKDQLDIHEDLNNYLKKACLALDLNQPPANIGTLRLLKVLHDTISKKMDSLPNDFLGASFMPSDGFSEAKKQKVYEITNLLQKEYKDRKETLIKRLDLTIESFKWSSKGKENLEEIETAYRPIRKALIESPLPGISHLLAAKQNDLLRIEKTSGASARRYTACQLNKILIGNVPDRGGRTWELEPPPPEMPSFKKRVNARGGHSGDGRHNQSFNSRNNFVDVSDKKAFYSKDKNDARSKIQAGVGFRDEPINPASFNLTYEGHGGGRGGSQTDYRRGSGRGQRRGQRGGRGY